MTDHYKTIGVDYDATEESIRRAFRSLVKKYHPDRNERRQKWADQQMKVLLAANRVLSNTTLRAVYDRQHGITHARQKAAAAAKYRAHAGHVSTAAEHILDCLLSGKARGAVEEYERLLRTSERFELSDHLSLRDWVDAKFLLAEQYERHKEYDKALDLYESLYNDERARQRYSHFVHEVRDRILHLCCRRLAPGKNPETAARCFMRALALELTRGKRAFLHKKLAECHLAAGDEASARTQLAVAFKLKSDLKGAGKICARLKVDQASPA